MHAKEKNYWPMECWRKQLYKKFQVSLEDGDCEDFFAKIFMNKIGWISTFEKKKHGNSWPWLKTNKEKEIQCGQYII